jgi:hypothetical protein
MQDFQAPPHEINTDQQAQSDFHQLNYKFIPCHSSDLQLPIYQIERECVGRGDA